MAVPEGQIGLRKLGKSAEMGVALLPVVVGGEQEPQAAQAEMALTALAVGPVAPVGPVAIPGAIEMGKSESVERIASEALRAAAAAAAVRPTAGAARMRPATPVLAGMEAMVEMEEIVMNIPAAAAAAAVVVDTATF